MKQRRRSNIRFVLKCGTLFALLVIGFSEASVKNAARNRQFASIGEVPYRRTALLLGTSRYSRSGAPNRFFWNRIDAAVELYEHGKIDRIIASGDNRFTTYNEPASMRDALVSRGIPDEAVVLDHAGFSTLDSVIRSRRVFEQHEIVIVSQSFHNARAIFIARHNELDAIGYNAGDVPYSDAFGVYVREYLARVKAVIDVYVLNREPRVLGEPQPL